MIREMKGDLIRDGRGILCHQVNYLGVMGGGIALSIKDKLLTDKQYKCYQAECLSYGSETLGEVMYMTCKDGRIVANMFSQNDFSAFRNGDITNYEAMEKCFRGIRAYAEQHNLPVSIPGYIGCGIAGGDWNHVMGIIYSVFQDSNIDVVIVYWEKRKEKTYDAE